MYILIVHVTVYIKPMSQAANCSLVQHQTFNMSAVALLTAVLAAWLTVLTEAQIPTVCTDQNSLENSICCPSTADGICGKSANRGDCVTLDPYNYDDGSSDVRENWPHYFTQVCKCYGNFAGYDCSRCKFGYYGTYCQDFQVLPRPPARDLSDKDWADFAYLVKIAKTSDSGYSAVLEESLPGNASIPTAPLSIYDYYVWIHHYTSKDTIDPGKNHMQGVPIKRTLCT